MQQILTRKNLLNSIGERLKHSQCVALLGPRQVGKTTLARQFAETWRGEAHFLDLEESATRTLLQKEPEQVLAPLKGLVVIDEIQKAPSLFEVLRPLCDRPDRKASYLLLGSASWELVKGVSESLAGRIQFVDVSGFSLAEAGAEHQFDLWLRGGFPRAFLAENAIEADRWLAAFFRTFVERDIRELSERIPAEAIARFWRMLAHCHAQVWNAAELARSLGVSEKTAVRHRDLLAGMFMIRVLQPWYENLGKRLLKSPKVYFRDSGLLHHLLRVFNLADLRDHIRYGASWEGFAIEQTLIAHGQRDAFFYATQRGAELDLLLLRHGCRWGFEFKCADVPSTTKSMHVALQDLGLERLYVVYPGKIRCPLGDKITALPLREIATLPLMAGR